jgi:hypothetical protein
MTLFILRSTIRSVRVARALLPRVAPAIYGLPDAGIASGLGTLAGRSIPLMDSARIVIVLLSGRA